MTEEQIAEINRIHAAVDDFASDMKTRLTQKVEAGYTGWDGDYPSSTLRREVVSDAMEAWDTACDDKAVDIANRCMMLWRRRPNAEAHVRCLDLFCCAGGAAMGLHRAGFDVTGVDIAPQPRYPFKFIQGDALAQDLTGFDFVWASPPCQGYCALKTMPNRREHPKLIEEVRDMLTAWGGPWIIENVEGAKNELRNPVMLCGSMFGLASNGFQLRRHRYFESNVPLTAPGPCRHAKRTLGVFGAKVRDIAQEKRHYAQPKETRGKPVGVVLPQAWGFEAMGCDWMKIDEASEAIPPAYSEHLGRQVMAWIGTANNSSTGQEPA